MSKPTETELLPERRHFEVNRGSNGWMVGYFEGVHFKKVAKFYQREALDRFLALPECPTCAYTVDDLARTPSPTPQSAEVRAREIVRKWEDDNPIDTDDAENLISAIASALSTPLPTLQSCVWSFDDNDDVTIWETSCGNAFEFTDGSPSDNKQKFCGYCGKLIEEVRTSEDDEDE